jgi:dGTP triphosphohydrolase
MDAEGAQPRLDQDRPGADDLNTKRQARALAQVARRRDEGPDRDPRGVLRRITPGCLAQRDADRRRTRETEGERARRIGNFIAGMTDRFALTEHQRLFDSTPDLR